MTAAIALAAAEAPGLGATLAAAAAALFLCLLPGYGLLRFFVPDFGRLRAVAAGPAVSAGVVYVVGQMLTAAEIPVNLWLGLAAVGMGSVLTAVAENRARGSDQDRVWSRRRPLLPGAALLSSLLGAALWAAGIGSTGAVPPHHDGFHHGYFVARIVNLGTLEPAEVIAGDVLSGGAAAAYYPFALHEQAAMVVQAVGVEVAAAFTLVSLVVVLVSLPAGMIVITTRLFPQRPLVAAVAGLVSVTAPGLTYSTSWWGGYAMAGGLAVTLGALELLLSLEKRLRLAPVLLAALAVSGVAGIHTSEMPLLAIMAAVLAASRARGSGWPAQVVKRVAVVATPFLISLLLLLPAIQQITSGYQERQFPVAAAQVPLSQSLAEVFALLVFVPPPTPAAIVLAFWVGIVSAVVLKQGRPWALLWAGFAVLYVWLWSFPSLLITKLTSFWYSDPFRLAYILVFLAVPFIAFSIGAPLEAIRRHRAEDDSSNSKPAADLQLSSRVLVTGAVGSCLLLAVLLVTSTASAVGTVRENYRDFSLVGEDERRAFRFLAERTKQGERVVNQHQDGSPWMYSLYGVAPLTVVKNDESERWRDRLYLLRNVPNINTDPRAAELATHFQIRYVYINERLFSNDESELTVEQMKNSSSFRQVFRSGTAHVFERTTTWAR